MKVHWHRPTLALFIAISSVILILSGCGGGGGGGSDTPPVDTRYTVNGVASKGLIRNGNVSLFSISSEGTKVTPALETTTTDATGFYSLMIDHSGPVLVEVSGGTYMDEATGSEVALTSVLRAALANVSGTVDIAVSPLTELAVRRAEVGGRLLVGHIDEANALVQQLVDCDIIATLPLDPQSSQAFAGGSSGEQNYTLMLAALSQMVTGADFEDIDAVLDAIEEDLDDSELDDTYAALSQSLDAFIGSSHNQTGAVAGDAAVLHALLSDAASGFDPTGDLAEAERLLVALLRASESERENAFNALDSYLDSFVGDSKEAHLFSALGTLMKLFTMDASAFIKTDLNIDFQTDFQLTDGAVVLDQFFQLATYDGDVAALLSGLIAQLDAVIADLAGAQGIDAVISLTGYDTVVFDDVDIKILVALSKAARAACLYAQSVDIGISNWQVPVLGGGSVDARDLIGTEVDLSDTQASALLTNHPALLSYKNTATKNEAIQAMKDAAAAYQAAVTDLDALGETGRSDRGRHALSSDSELDFWVMKGFAEKTLPSLLDAIDNPGETIIGVEGDERCEAVVVGVDGYAYDSEYSDLYTQNFAPNPAVPVGHGHTPFSILAGADGLRNLALTLAALGEGYEPYSQGESTLYQAGVAEVDWEEPLDTNTLAVAPIVIDGSDADWTSVPVFRSFQDMSVKLARDDQGAFYVLLTREGGLLGGDFNSGDLRVSMLDWNGCTGSDDYEFYVSLSTWSNSIDVQANESNVDGIGGYIQFEDGTHLKTVSNNGVVTGVEIKSDHLSRLTKKGAKNYVYTSRNGGTWDYRSEMVKFLPESIN